MWPRDGNVGDGFVDLKKLQAMPCKLLAENGRDLERKATLIFPNAADQPQQFGAAQASRGRPAQGVGVHRFNDVLFVGLAEVFLDCFHASQPQWLG